MLGRDAADTTATTTTADIDTTRLISPAPTFLAARYGTIEDRTDRLLSMAKVYTKNITELRGAHAKALLAKTTEHTDASKTQLEAHQQEILQIGRRHDEALAKLQREHAEALLAKTTEHNEALQKQLEAHQQEIVQIGKDDEVALTNQTTAHKDAMANLQTEHASELKDQAKTLCTPTYNTTMQTLLADIKRHKTANDYLVQRAKAQEEIIKQLEEVESTQAK
jgi:hypothetical protein